MKIYVSKMIIAAIFIFIFFIMLEVLIEVVFPVYRPVSVLGSPSLKNNFKIVQISDVHSKKLGEYSLKKIREFNPDFIAVTGDVVNRYDKELVNVSDFAEKISKLGIPVYYVTGNHDTSPVEKNEKIISIFKDMGITILRNQSAFIDESNVTVVGINDWNTDRPDLSKAFKDVQKTSYVVLLSHNPVVYYHLGKYKVDLVLSGHTHGGQISLPLLGPLALPDQNYKDLEPLTKGLIPLEDDGGWIYIDSGYGTSSLPIRFMNRSQISFITINKE